MKKSIKCWPQTPRTLQAPVCLSPGCHIRYLPWIHYLMLVSTHVRTEPKHSLRGSKCALLISKIKRYFRQTEWTKSKRGNTDDRAWTLSTQDAVLKRNSHDRQRRKPERALGDFLAQIWLWIILTQRTQTGCEGCRIYRHTPLGLEPNFCPN